MQSRSPSVPSPPTLPPPLLEDSFVTSFFCLVCEVTMPDVHRNMDPSVITNYCYCLYKENAVSVVRI